MKSEPMKTQDIPMEELTWDEMEMCIDAIYGTLYEEMDMVQDYHQRHGTESALILTIATISAARAEAAAIREKIEGKVVVEIGAGVGLLAIAMAEYAKQVFAIEVDPGWSWGFIRHIYLRKPPNLTFIFGKAEEMAGNLKGDISIIRTRSGHEEMRKAARLFSPEIFEM